MAMNQTADDRTRGVFQEVISTCVTDAQAGGNIMRLVLRLMIHTIRRIYWLRELSVTDLETDQDPDMRQQEEGGEALKDKLTGGPTVSVAGLEGVAEVVKMQCPHPSAVASHSAILANFLQVSKISCIVHGICYRI